MWRIYDWVDVIERTACFCTSIEFDTLAHRPFDRQSVAAAEVVLVLKLAITSVFGQQCLAVVSALPARRSIFFADCWNATIEPNIIGRSCIIVDEGIVCKGVVKGVHSFACVCDKTSLS